MYRQPKYSFAKSPSISKLWLWQSCSIHHGSAGSGGRTGAVSAPTLAPSLAEPLPLTPHSRLGQVFRRASSETVSPNATKRRPLASTVDPKEVAKFSAVADSWWDINGMHKGLHAMNPTRLSFLKSALCRHFGREESELRPFTGLRVIDVGCGGGLLCEPLARLGATVVGLDASERNVKVAAVHAAKDPITESIEYICSTAEELVEEGKTFDAVFALEVIEHVAEPLEFMKALGALCRPGGAVAVSTLNRTVRSYALAIAAAEYALRWLPPGTHDWSRFVTPQETALLMTRSGLKMEEIAGMVFDPLTWKWGLSEDLAVNYITYGTKEGDANSPNDTDLSK